METLYKAKSARGNKLSPVVREIGSIHFEGNVIPHSWYQHPRLRLNSGAPNLVAIILLSDLLYWHRPVIARDEATGEVIPLCDKFSGERYQARYASIARRFGLSKRQVQDAAAFLSERGIIEREKVARVETASGDVLGNVVFLTPLPDAIRDLNTLFFDNDEDGDPITLQRNRYPENGGDAPEGRQEGCSEVPPTTPQRNRSNATTQKGVRSSAKGSTLQGDRYDGPAGDISETTAETSPDISMETTTDSPRPQTEPLAVDATPAAVSHKNEYDADELDALVNLVMALGIAEADAQSIVVEALKADDGAERVRRNAAWYPYSKQSKAAKSHGATFRACVRGNWARVAETEANARASEAKTAKIQRRYVTAPTTEKQEKRTGALEPAGQAAAETMGDEFTEAELDAVADTLSDCAKDRVMREAIERALEKSRQGTRAHDEIRSALNGHLPLGAAGQLIRVERRAILTERARRPIPVNGKLFYDEQDAQIDLDFA